MPNQSPQLMTVADAAQALGVSQGTVYRWLRETPPRLVQCQGIPGQVLIEAESVRTCAGKKAAGRPRKAKPQ